MKRLRGGNSNNDANSNWIHVSVVDLNNRNAIPKGITTPAPGIDHQVNRNGIQRDHPKIIVVQATSITDSQAVRKPINDVTMISILKVKVSVRRFRTLYEQADLFHGSMNPFRKTV